MKKIVVITTGGTIGSATQGGTINVSQRKNPVIDRALKGIEYKVLSPLNMLSENARPETWNLIAQTVLSLCWDDCAGIIIMHGTDTLCYTGAALSYLLSHIPIPVVLVSAAYEPNDPRSNALINMQGAVDFIRTGGLRGVFAAYSNGGDCEIHLAARLEEITAWGAQLHSYGGAPLGHITGHVFIPNRSPLNPAAASLNQIRQTVFSAETKFRNAVALIKAFPGIRYGQIDLTGCRAVLHSLYHSGTGPVSGEDSLTDLIRRCAEAGIPSYFTPAHRGDQYSTTRAIMAAGAIPLPTVSTPAAYVKLVYYYNTPGASPELITQDLGFEILES